MKDDVNVKGIGAYFPARCVSNETLSKLKGIDPQWVEKRTGISNRSIAEDGVGTVEMASAAAHEALAQSGVAADQVGLILVASCFHGRASTARELKRKLKLANARPVDLATPQFGFLDGLRLAIDVMASTGAPALVVGSEGFSNATGLSDRRNCYLLSDGAGACLLSKDRGFARLDVEVMQGGLAVSDAGAEEADVHLGEALAAALRRFEGDRAAAALHVVTQANPASASLRRLQAEVRLHNPFGDGGRLLSAALPMSLYRALSSGELRAGDSCLLFAADGLGLWSGMLLELEAAPGLAHREGALQAATAPHLFAGNLAQLSSELAAQAGADDPARGRPVCVTLRLAADDQSRSFGGKPWPEVLSLLTRRTRSSDAILQLEGEPSCALVLRHIDEEDAAKLCRRLKRSLEELDPAGEVGLAVDAQLVVFRPDQTPEAWAGEIIERLSRT